MKHKCSFQNISITYILLLYVVIILLSSIQTFEIPFTLKNTFHKRLLSINDSIPSPLILIKVYIGSPLKEYNLIFDTFSNYTILLTNTSTLSKVINPYSVENSSTSKIQNKSENTLHIYESSYGVGCIVQDQITPNLLIRPTLFKFILMNEYLHASLNNNADGIAGFNYDYNQNIYSLLDTFYSQRAITNKLFAFKFNSTKQGKVYLGETGVNDNENLFKSCNSFKNVWGCSLKSININNNKNDNNELKYELKYNTYMRLSTSTYPVEFPFVKIEEMLLMYKNILNKYNKNNNCIFQKISPIKDVLICDNIEWYNNKYLPGINFRFNDNGLVLELQGKDLFSYSEKHGYICNIQGNSLLFEKDPKIGLVVLKNYHVIFNKDHELIKFNINPIMYDDILESDSEYGKSIVIGMLICITIAFIIFGICCRRQHLRNKNDKITFNQIHEINTIILNN